MNKINLVEKEIEKVVSQSPSKTDPAHSKGTKKWLLKLNPNADDALQIAALAHDIERGYYKGKKSKEDPNNYDKHKEENSKRSAEVICDILKKYDFDKKFITRVRHLVLKHEIGGDEELNILKDADSISFFEENLEYYFHKYGEEKVRFKIKYMFDRMSKKAQEIVKKLKYNDKKLNSIFQEIVT